MLFRKRDEIRPAGVAIARDVIEIVAILAAGIWAFYLFAYENRIKPSFANPEIDITASMQNLGERNGLIAVSLHQELHNVGTVRADFLGIAVNVYGRRVSPSNRREPPAIGTTYDFAAYYRTTPGDPVLSLAYVTKLGNPSSSQGTELDPGDVLKTDHVFYVPRGRFDLLTVQVDGVFTKFENATIPTHLERTRAGASAVVTSDKVRTVTYNTNPITSLNLSY